MTLGLAIFIVLMAAIVYVLGCATGYNASEKNQPEIAEVSDILKPAKTTRTPEQRKQDAVMQLKNELAKYVKFEELESGSTKVSLIVVSNE